MVCPYCGAEMESGILQAGGSTVIGWREKPSIFPSGLNMERLDTSDWKCAYIPASRCPRCRKIILTY